MNNRARGWMALVVSAGLLGACDKRDQSPPAQGAAATTTTVAPSPKPEPAPARGVAATTTTLSRESPELSAASLRRLAETSLDPAQFAVWLDPSQSSLSARFVGPALIYFARLGELRRAAAERWGHTGAEAVETAGAIYQVELGNGLREMFEAERFEEVRRDGPKAFVMANIAGDQPVGAALCFQENQGEWKLLLADGDTPWPQSKLSNFAALVGGPMTTAPTVGRAFSELAERTRRGEFKTVEDLVAAIETLKQS